MDKLPTFLDISIALALCVIAVKQLTDSLKTKDVKEQELLDRFINDQYLTIEKLREYLEVQGNTVRQVRDELARVEQRITSRQTEILVQVNAKVQRLTGLLEAMHRRMDDMVRQREEQSKS